MKFPLYRKLILHTGLTKQEARQALIDNISKPNSLFDFKRPTLKFTGYLDNDQFKIERVINYRNSFLPTIRGRLTTIPSGTEIACTFKPHAFVTVFVIIWIGGMLFATLAVFIQGITTAGVPKELFIPLGMLIVGTLFITTLYNSEYDSAKVELIKILKSPDKEL